MLQRTRRTRKLSLRTLPVRIAPSLLSLFLLHASLHGQGSASEGWPEYGGNLGGQRYSSARQINKENVSSLRVAWTFHTHALDIASSANSVAAFEATPVLWKGTLYFDSPFDQVFAVDALTGKLKWTFDPKISRTRLYIVTSRGVALWHAQAPGPGVCGETAVLVATLDRRLIALDAASGKPCPRFGTNGSVDLTKGVEVERPDLYFFTSPPIVVRNTIVLGASVGDNQQLFAGSGATRGFDAVTGQQKWKWEPAPWALQQGRRISGSGNAWARLSADPEHDLVFLPTGAASVDYYGGFRPGDNRDANSIVALRASTGEKVWAFQLVHHDVWDYDTASQPLLFTFRGSTPAVAVTNKTGMIYVFHRLTGEPLYPIVERRVPASRLIGESTSSTQPFSSLPPLQPILFSKANLGGTTADRNSCGRQMDELQYKGLFTPPSEAGAIIFPAALGGPNWGSSAIDIGSSVMYTRVSAIPFRLRMVLERPELLSATQRFLRHLEHKVPSWMGGEEPAERASRLSPDRSLRNLYRPPDMGLGGQDASVMRGSPYTMRLEALISPSGLPCGPEPYGSLVATDLNTGKQRWSVPHGSMSPAAKGSIGTGGPIVTAGGLVFVASTNDPFLRAYDAETGKEVWKAQLPATANATPMTYIEHGRQFVAIAVGGHRLQEKDESDVMMAFALSESGSKKPTHARVRSRPSLVH